MVQARPRAPRPTHPEWGPLRAVLTTKRLRVALSRLMSFCETHEIPPAGVCGAVVDRFRAHLEADTAVPVPHECHRGACRAWNRAAETVPGWPQTKLSLPDHRRPRRSMPIGSFPASLQADLANYLSSVSDGDVFADRPQTPLRASTVHQREVEIGLALSALVASGTDPASITSLDHFLEPDAFTAILRQYVQDGKPRPFARNLAHTLIGMARRRLGSEPDAAPKIKAAGHPDHPNARSAELSFGCRPERR
ncbi:MAG: hypothetical protein JOY83_23785 [Alphaproteobacteria bacterium]|nr:hypothetical protein [Alphaproteobacteria bacterium]